MESIQLEGWRIHDNLARDAKEHPTMKHGFDLSGLPNTADAVVGHGNHVRGAIKAGYLKRPGHTKFTADNNIGTFETN